MKLKEKKILHAILFFANKLENKKINRLKLMKLLWLSDRIHLNKYGRLILNDRYNALPYGSIPSNAMDMSRTKVDGFLQHKGYDVIAETDFDEQIFSNSDIEVMEGVWEKFKNVNQFDLSEYSHRFPEWLRFEDSLKGYIKSYSIQIEDFFETPEDITSLPYSKAESETSRTQYNSHTALQSFLSD